MPKMDDATLKAILASERADALASVQASKLTDDRESALAYYMSDMSEDMPAADGRSRAVSSDVSDTVEGMMPPLMEIFAGGDEVVKFDAVGPEDVRAAEQETDYVNHVFMQKNPGFIILYSFIKDALLSKNGVVKVYWEEKEEEQEETFWGLPDAAYGMLKEMKGVTIVEHTEREGIVGQQPKEEAAY